MSEAKRLHPAAIIFNMLKIIKEGLIGSLGIIVILALQDGAFLVLGISTGALLLITLLASILKWLRYTYSVEDDELRVEHGIFIRKKRYISKHRIQSIDLTQSVIHRLFGLVRVEIETAGSDSDKEASLKAVAYSEGVRIRNQLKFAAASIEEEEGDELKDTAGQEAHEVQSSGQITLKRLFIAGTTSGSLGVLAAIAGVIFSQIEQVIPDHIYDEALSWVTEQSLDYLAVLMAAVIIPLWMFGIAGTMVKYGRFTITRQADELFITRGLLEKKQITVPLKRIQAVGFRQSLLRQPFGYGTPFAEIAGGSLEENSEFSTILFPVMKKSELNPFLDTMLPETARLPETLTPVPARARKFYLLRALLPVLAAFVMMTIYVPAFVWVPSVLLIGAIALGWMRHRDAGVIQDGKWLHIRIRGLALTQVVLHHRRIQAFEKKQHVIQKHQDLATMEVSIVGVGGTGRHYVVKDMNVEHVDKLSNWFSYRKEMQNEDL